MPENLHETLPPAIYIATYDICGYNQATGIEKPTRKTGIVTHTHQVIEGLSQLNPSMEITVSQTATPEERPYYLTTPEGQTVYTTSLHAKHPALNDPVTKQVSPARIGFHYETDVYNPNNPIYRAYAEHYAADIQRARTPYVLLQNPNPLIGVLKAEELGYISPSTSEQLKVTTVIHDTVSYPRRFEYIGDRLTKTRMDIAFIAISRSGREYLLEHGIPEESINLIPNGINIERFDAKVNSAKNLGTFACVRARDNLPEDKKTILCPAPRVRLKGHLVIVEAAKILKDQGKLADAYMAFAGKNMSDAKSIGTYTEEIEASIQEKGLADDIHLLDSVSPDELAACYGEAYISLLPSTHPEGLPYTNFESMLAGAPVITSRSGGPLDYIVHGENGLFVEPGDPIDLANAIDRLLSSPELHAKIVQNGRRTAEQYSLQRMIQGYAEVITRN